MAKISFNVKESYNLSMEELRRLQDSQGTQLSSSRLASSKPGTAAVSPPEEINQFAIASSEGIETSAPQNEGALAERFKKIEEENKNRDKKAKDKQKKSQLIQNKINTDLLEKVHKLEYVVENGQSIKIRGKRIEDFLREELNQSLLQNINELQDNLGKNGVKLGKVDKRLTKIEQYFKGVLSMISFYNAF
jgi:predicted metal-dependent hydrolase